MKLLKRYVSLTIWGIIALNLLLMGVSHIPVAQSFIGDKVAEAIARKLGTQVAIGRVDLGFLNRIIMDDVKIYDQWQKEMVSIARLSAKVDLAPLTEGKISISSAQLFGANLRLYRQNAQTAPNFQFALDSLASKDTTSQTPLNVRVNSFIMRRSSLSYDQLDQARTEGVFNPAHLRFTNLSANISLKTLTDDSLNVNVKRFGFREHSGLEVDRVNFRLEAGKRQALLTDLLIQMPSSQLKADTLKANYQLDEKGIVAGTLSYSGKLYETGITPSDLRCFMPSLKNFQRKINLATDISGTDYQATIGELSLATEEKDIDIHASGWVENWNKRPAWHLQMNNLTLSETSLDFLAKTIHELPSELTRMGNLQLSGVFDRDLKGETTLQARIQSGAGDMDGLFVMAPDRTFHGTATTEGLNMGQLLDNEQFGLLASDISFNGQLHDQKAPDITVNGTVGKLEYNGYHYSHITLDGNYNGGSIAGTFSIDDPHLSAQLSGELAEALASTDKEKTVRIQGTIDHFSPAATGLYTQWGDVIISANIDADFIAHNLNDARGDLRISHFTMSATEQSPAYQLDNLTLSSGFDEGIHYLTLKSDFADAELRGHYDYGTLQQSFTNLIASKLPTLPGLPATKPTDNNFSLHLLLNKTDWLKRFLDVNLELQQPISLAATINDHTQVIQLDGDLPQFSYNGAPYADGSIHITSPSDTMRCEVQLTKLMDNGHHLGLNLQAQASHNQLGTSLRWDNHLRDERMSGELNSNIQLYRNFENKPEARVRIIPSHLILNGSSWNVESSDILYHENYLSVDNFSISHGAEHIIIDGIASRHANDTLTVDLNEVEVGYILDLVNFHSVEFAGKASGHVLASSLFNHFAAKADLTVDEFKFENGRMGTLFAHANWNQEKEQIEIRAIADDGPDAQTHVNGYISPTHNTIDLGIDADGTYIDFMHNFTESFISEVTGHADGSVRLAGTLDNINLTGQLVVDGKASITALNTTYELRRDTIIMVPDEIELHRLPIYDREGSIGYLSGGIHHQHLTNLTFDLFVEADNLLAYDFTDFGESLFYGTVYATGNVSIQGRPGEVIIDCDVTPQSNSVFVYNAANPDEISKQEFIVWETNDEDHPGHHSISDTAPITNTDIYINFLINATPEGTLRLLMDANTKDYITLNGDGVIRATFHNKGPFNMFGTYTVDHGTYGITIQNIIKKNFTFNRGGTIVFGGDPYNAALNLQAVYTVNGVSLSDLNIGNSFTNNTIRVNCLMNIGGQANSPQVDFDLEMPNVNADEQQMVRSVINGQQEMNQQVVYLLGIGRFYNQGANNNAGDQQSDQTSLAMQSFLSGTLSTQINTLLNQIIKNDNWNFGANISTGNEGWHNAEYEGIVNGRMLNNRLLFNGQFGYRDNATQANPSFIGDFDVQYLLHPNGNFSLKMYNQTNDRYFTKSSLNTQGIGIIMKKDFNGLGDLFSSQKKKKKTKKEK